jgi:peptidoglycan hydrolase-like protein with peptidoglycan-binding domain
MKKIIRLSESQLIKIIRESLTEKKIISEQATVLQSGDKGYFVKSMQQNLIKLGYDLGKFKDDGKFGGKTLLAIRKFQEDEGISPISNNADVNLQNKIQNKADGKKESYFSDKNLLYKVCIDFVFDIFPFCFLQTKTYL